MYIFKFLIYEERRREGGKRGEKEIYIFNSFSHIFDIMTWTLKKYIACNHQSYFWAIISKRKWRAGKYQEEQDTVGYFMRTALMGY